MILPIDNVVGIGALGALLIMAGYYLSQRGKWFNDGLFDEGETVFIKQPLEKSDLK